MVGRFFAFSGDGAPCDTHRAKFGTYRFLPSFVTGFQLCKRQMEHERGFHLPDSSVELPNANLCSGNSTFAHLIRFSK